MPNWCYTDITIKGDGDEITRFLAEATKGYEIVEPTADDPKGEGVQVMDPQTTHAGLISFGAITGVPSDYAQNWYDRGLELWGIKWDIETPLGDVTRLVDEVAHFRIESAWSFPEDGIKAWSSAFPELLFCGSITEEANLFAGAFVARDGRIWIRDYDPSSLVPFLPPLPDDLDTKTGAGWEALQSHWENLRDAVEDENGRLLSSLLSFAEDLAV